MKRKRSMLEVAYAGGLKEESTAFAGAGLLVELFRQSGVSATAEGVLRDEFREGNVPASRDIRRVVDEAFEALSPGEWKVRVRSDSAAYEPEGILDHWEGRGWEFAVSADMSPQLRAAIQSLPEEAWHTWKTEARGTVREWAEVPYVPSRRQESKEPVTRTPT